MPTTLDDLRFGLILVRTLPCLPVPDLQQGPVALKTHEFRILITAPVDVVWRTMLDRDTYQLWTAPFMEGSTYEGSWAEGARIHFLAPSGEGLCSVIAENRPHELIRIEHVGVVKNGVEDTTSEQVRSWAPAYETYRFTPVDGGTEVTVEQDLGPEHEQAMAETWTKAFAILKTLCESK